MYFWAGHVWIAFEDGFDQNTAAVVNRDLAATKKECLNHTLAWVPAFGWSRLPQRKLRKIGLILNLCPSHTEIFSKRRKIYSWLCERLELMWQLLKNAPASRALCNAFDLDFEFHWVNGREIEARWGHMLEEDNCNDLALAKVAGIASMPYNECLIGEAAVCLQCSFTIGHDR